MHNHQIPTRILEISGISQMPCGIWEISQKPGYLGKFSKCLGFWKILQIFSHLRNLQNLKNTTLKFLWKFRNLGHFPNTWGSVYPGNFTNA